MISTESQQATPVSDDGWTGTTFTIVPAGLHERPATTTTAVSPVVLATLPADLACSCRTYDASPAMVAEAAKTLTPSQVDDALLDAWFIETKHDPVNYAIGWSQACDRIIQVESDWENTAELSDDELPPNIAELRDSARMKKRTYRRALQWHCLNRQHWPEQHQASLVHWIAKYDACRMACLLIDAENDAISTREVVSMLRRHPTVPSMRLAIRLRREATWRAGR